MNTYPADERRISEVERGRSCEAVVPLPPGESLRAGDTVRFALSHADPGQPPAYVYGGDSVVVCLTDVTDLGRIDTVSGQVLVRLTWRPPGQGDSSVSASAARRAVKPGSRGRG